MSSSPVKPDRGVVLITGAAGGIGRGIAKAFGSAGFALALNDIADQDLHHWATELKDERFEAETFVADVTDASAVQKMIAEIETALGPVAVLINNAAVFSPAALLDITDGEWDAVQDVNVKGCVHTAQAVVPGMKERGGGAIVNVASLAGKRGRTIFCKPGESTWAAYAVSKAGVAALTFAMAYEWAPFHIRVNAVAPGPILTGYQDKAKIARTPEVPVGRIGTVEDVAEAVLFLASEKSGFIQGEVIDVNGGLVMD